MRVFLDYTPNRGGALAASFGESLETRLPIAIPLRSRAPELLHRHLELSNFSIIPLVHADAIVGNLLERPISANELRAPKIKAYIEAREPWVIEPAVVPSETRPGDFVGVLVALSPVVLTSQESYFLMEFSNNLVVAVAGKKCMGWRCLVQIGRPYRLRGLVQHSIGMVLGPDPPLDALQSVSDSEIFGSPLFCNLLGPSNPWPDNLYSYRGRVTRRLGESIFEMDGAVAVYTTHTPLRPFQSLGIRVGAEVLLQSVSAVYLQEQFRGFVVTFRSEISVLEFAPAPVASGNLCSTPHLRFDLPSISYQGLHVADAVWILDVLENVQTADQQSAAAVLTEYLSSLVAHEQLVRVPCKDQFLEKWNDAVQCEWERPHGVSLLDLVREAVGAPDYQHWGSTSSISITQSRAPQNAICLGRVVESPITAQMCFADASGQTEVRFRSSQPPEAGTQVLLLDFRVMVERFGACTRPLHTNIREGLGALGGQVLFHGHVSPSDNQGVVRVWLDVHRWLAGDKVVRSSKSAVEYESEITVSTAGPIMLQFSTQSLSYHCRMRASIGRNQSIQVSFSSPFPDSFSLLADRHPCLVSNLQQRNDGVWQSTASTRIVSKGLVNKAPAFPMMHVSDVLSTLLEDLPPVIGLVQKAELKTENEPTGRLPAAWNGTKLHLCLRDLRTPDIIKSYFTLDGALLGVGVIEIGAVVVIENAVLYCSQASGKRMLKGQARIRLWQSPALHVAQYPKDLSRLPLTTLSNIRNGKRGGLVLISLFKIYKVRLERRASSMPAYLTLMCVVGDATDEAELYCDVEELVWDMLGVPKLSQMKLAHAHKTELAPVLTYSPEMAPMEHSPEGVFGRTIESHLSLKPRLAYVSWEKPYEGNRFQAEPDAFTIIERAEEGSGTDNLSEAASATSSRKAFTRTTGFTKVQTATVPKLSLNLLMVDKPETGGEALVRDFLNRKFM